ncbi:uncharacterized protein Z518_09207 [Rhinocladiella mackenziei CBS 650.93]|uniref:Alcohol dehydrogenase-like C-terminal domain-containing protein n=1 Tax=Rhinocladiella mackenziei CBS 650.93 TaxID=1442369 RepID=A0A0D2IE14_9EURO|nr:uncharacterized protein Z518_09207 [Rhinocladiella mackenziei CBS 650.93]KIX01481.1 hypothetical protein Z518_09207 [Rhinocladiella mackenziei CBS 650.93]
MSTCGPKNRSFQKRAITRQETVVSLPDEIRYEHASAVFLVISTATRGLYGLQHLRRPLPILKLEKVGKRLLVWGAAGGVGMQVVQFTTASGFDVAATASPESANPTPQGKRGY